MRRELQTREGRERMERRAARPWGVFKSHVVKQWDIEAPERFTRGITPIVY